LWWTNLTVAIMFTIYVLMQLYDEYGGVVKLRTSALVRRNTVTKGVQMVFGN
jgi:hypothetical protein